MSTFIISTILAVAFLVALKKCIKDAKATGTCGGNCKNCGYSCSMGSGALEEYLDSRRVDIKNNNR